MTPLIEARAICKQFSGVPVLKGIDFTLLAGQVHALMGGNGAGKSTLMKIIAGVETPDNGELSVAGHSYARLTPVQAHKLGIYLVPQEPLLFPNLTVRENILFRLPRERERENQLTEKLQQLQCQLNLDATASTLEVADQQMVEILRGLMRNATILILDEPTASLTPGETERLFRQIRALQDLGVGIVFISHKLPEIRQLASHVSVMRDGAVLLSGETAQFDDNALIAAMTPVSREKGLSDAQKLWLALPGNRRTQPQDFPVLRVDDLTGEGLSISRLRSTQARSSVWPGWSDPGAPNLPRHSTACVRCVADGSGWRIRRSLTRAWAPGWTKAWFICRKTGRCPACSWMHPSAGTPWR